MRFQVFFIIPTFLVIIDPFKKSQILSKKDHNMSTTNYTMAHELCQCWGNCFRPICYTREGFFVNDPGFKDSLRRIGLGTHGDVLSGETGSFRKTPGSGSDNGEELGSFTLWYKFMAKHGHNQANLKQGEPVILILDNATCHKDIIGLELLRKANIHIFWGAPNSSFFWQIGDSRFYNMALKNMYREFIFGLIGSHPSVIEVDVGVRIRELLRAHMVVLNHPNSIKYSVQERGFYLTKDGQCLDLGPVAKEKHLARHRHLWQGNPFNHLAALQWNGKHL